jgi:hypothetical protein
MAKVTEHTDCHLTIAAPARVGDRRQYREGRDPETVDGEYVVSNFFPVLGIPGGRAADRPEDDAAAASTPPTH